jgi:glycosyltransferase involved in cell wall biosynthesis
MRFRPTAELSFTLLASSLATPSGRVLSSQVERAVESALPAKVVITGGRELGGVTSFAEGLRAGFTELGIPVEVISPSRIFLHWRELRNPRILKILSTSAVFAAPLARRAICMAHGVTRAYLQGFWKMMAVVGTFKLANASCGAQLVAVSDYVAAHLQTIFNLRIDAVVRNPLRPAFLESAEHLSAERNFITYVGVLDAVKNLHLLLPAMREILEENPGLRICIAGDGPQRAELEGLAAGDKRIEFAGVLDPFQVREKLRRSRVFISGTPTEALGIAYLEALSQECAVAMPAAGGGLEIAPEQIGRGIHLFSASLDRDSVANALRRALVSAPKAVSVAAYAPRAVAEAYLAADARFSALGSFHAEAGR